MRSESGEVAYSQMLFCPTSGSDEAARNFLEKYHNRYNTISRQRSLLWDIVSVQVFWT